MGRFKVPQSGGEVSQSISDANPVTEIFQSNPKYREKKLDKIRRKYLEKDAPHRLGLKQSFLTSNKKDKKDNKVLSILQEVCIFYYLCKICS